jgi:hypothetical protein
LRCFRSEFRRVIFAFAARIASVLVGGCLGWGVVAAFRTMGIIGIGIVEPRWTGCILMGPVDFDLLSGMIDNSLAPNSLR